ncbi:unnamed protein product, partial [Amoebophrya sp. A25]|eukprot:GSA25T00005805001.1
MLELERREEQAVQEKKNLEALVEKTRQLCEERLAEQALASASAIESTETDFALKMGEMRQAQAATLLQQRSELEQAKADSEIALRQQIDSLSSAAATLSAQLDATKTEVAQRTLENNNLKAEVAERERQATDASDELVRLRKRNTAVDEEFSKLLGKHDLELRTRQSEFGEQLATRDRQHEMEVHSIRETQTDLSAQLQATQARLAADRVRLGEEVTALDTECRAALSRARAEAVRLDAELASATHEVLSFQLQQSSEGEESSKTTGKRKAGSASSPDTSLRRPEQSLELGISDQGSSSNYFTEQTPVFPLTAESVSALIARETDRIRDLDATFQREAAEASEKESKTLDQSQSSPKQKIESRTSSLVKNGALQQPEQSDLNRTQFEDSKREKEQDLATAMAELEAKAEKVQRKIAREGRSTTLTRLERKYAKLLKLAKEEQASLAEHIVSEQREELEAVPGRKFAPIDEGETAEDHERSKPQPSIRGDAGFDSVQHRVEQEIGMDEDHEDVLNFEKRSLFVVEEEVYVEEGFASAEDILRSLTRSYHARRTKHVAQRERLEKLADLFAARD